MGHEAARLAPMITSLALIAAPSSPDSDWPSFAAIPAAHATRRTIRSTGRTWRNSATSHKGALQPETPLNKRAAFEATPILVENRLVFSTPYNAIVALDPKTGAKLWEHDAAGGKPIVIAAGGHGKLGTTLGDSVIAFALP